MSEMIARLLNAWMSLGSSRLKNAIASCSPQCRCSAHAWDANATAGQASWGGAQAARCAARLLRARLESTRPFFLLAPRARIEWWWSQNQPRSSDRAGVSRHFPMSVSVPALMLRNCAWRLPCVFTPSNFVSQVGYHSSSCRVGVFDMWF